MRRHPQISLLVQRQILYLTSLHDTMPAQNLKLETCQATRAPVIEHVKTSLVGASAGPKGKAKAKYDAQAVKTSSVKPIDRLMLNGKLPVVCSTCTDQQCQDLFLNIVGLLV